MLLTFRLQLWSRSALKFSIQTNSLSI